MKKYIVLSICLFLLLCLFGCKKNESESEPKVLTIEATYITNCSALLSGDITSLGTTTSLRDFGFCYSSTNEMPTVDDTFKSLGTTSSLGNYSVNISSLTPSTGYYFRAYVENEFIAIYGNPLFFHTRSVTDTTTPILSELKVGDNYQGGIIAYIFDSNDLGYEAGEVHGLIITESDQGFGLSWSNGTDILVGTSREIGDGMENTNSIIVAQGTGNYAAKLCRDLNIDGYNDWYLPSMDELNLLYLNREAIDGNFMGSNWYYWSSTERDQANSWAQCLYDGDQRSDAGNKSIAYLIRPMRTF